MTMFETQSIINSATQLEISRMEISDQMMYLSAISEMAEKIKPLVVKYSSELPSESKFLFRM